MILDKRQKLLFEMLRIRFIEEEIAREYKNQEIRLFLKDAKGNVLESRDITIVKKYVTQEEIDLNNIVFK